MLRTRRDAPLKKNDFVRTQSSLAQLWVPTSVGGSAALVWLSGRGRLGWLQGAFGCAVLSSPRSSQAEEGAGGWAPNAPYYRSLLGEKQLRKSTMLVLGRELASYSPIAVTAVNQADSRQYG